MAYAKGEAPRNLDAAQGGPTLGRVRDFQKSQEVGMAGPPNKQDYASKGGAGETHWRQMPAHAEVTVPDTTECPHLFPKFLCAKCTRPPDVLQAEDCPASPPEPEAHPTRCGAVD